MLQGAEMDLIDRLSQVNELRKKALADPHFISESDQHHRAIERSLESQPMRRRKKREKTLQEIYT